MGELATQSRYAEGDGSRSEIDPERSNAYEQDIAPVREFSRRLVSWANLYAISGGGKPRAAACAIAAMSDWARHDALGVAHTAGANFNRATFLSAVAGAYVQVSAYPALSDGDRSLIEGWLAELSRATRAYYEQRQARPRSVHNNIMDWAALGVAMAGVATGDRDNFAWGMQGYRRGVCEARPDGALPAELKRGSRALEYHLFALQPLVALAALGKANGEDTFPTCNGALDRIITFTLGALDGEPDLERAAGAQQTDVGPMKSDADLAWLEIYAFNDRGTRWADRLSDLRPLSHTSLGGRLTDLYQRQ